MKTHLGRFPAEVERPEPLKFAWPIVVLPELFTVPGHLAILIGYLATIGWEVYAPDLSVAAGKDKTPALERLGFHDLVEVGAEALRALGRDAILVGHGAGGLLALKLAEHPGVKAAVALAPLVPGFRTPLFMHAANLFRAWRGRALKPPSGRKLFEFVADAEPFQRAQVIKTMAPCATTAALEIARGEIAFSDASRPVSRLIVAGDSDIFAPVDRVEAFARRLGTQVVRLAGCGHWLVGGHALERVVNEVQRFLVRALGQDLLLLYSDQPEEEEPE